MTTDPQALNIAIAKWMGWREISWSELTNPREAREQKLFCRHTENRICGWLPDFCGDLNCMALAEAKLREEEKVELRYLLNLVKEMNEHFSLGWRAERTYKATALQRASALVKALNLPIE